MITHLEQIKNIELTYKVKVLYACKAGSRAWGLSSPYSDKDLGLIYHRPLEWYLSISEKQDVIDLSSHTDYDGFGWDLKKALHLLRQSNAIIFDWLQSPTPYIGHPNILANIRTISQQCFNTRKVMYHYLGLGNNLIHKFKTKEEIQLKSYLLLIRSTLAAMWVKEKGTPPPVLFSNLLVIAESQPMALMPIHKVVLFKKQAKPDKFIKKIPILDQFIKDNRRSCSDYAESLSIEKEKPVELVDKLFRQIILPTKNQEVGVEKLD